MGEKLRNIVCEPSDFIQKIKQDIFELISLNKTVCNNLPKFNIPKVLPNVPDLNPSQAVIDFLNDILAIVSGINFDEMRMQLINWLVENLSALEKDLSFSLIDSLNSCFLCKITPNIPDWMFTKLSNGNEGIGINIELNKIDLTCMFGFNPNTSAGKLIYDGNTVTDMNAFLWSVIQKNGEPLVWKDPVSGVEIAEFRYYENSSIAYIEKSGSVDYQDITPRPRVFNMRIMETYRDKNLIVYMNDYFNSLNPFFDVDKVVPNIVDLIYGTITNKVNLGESCLTKQAELDESISNYIDGGIDNLDITFDNSFYTFDNQQIKNIKEKVKQKQEGKIHYKNCCTKEVSYIDYGTVESGYNSIKSGSTLQEKIDSYTKTIDKLVEESSSKVNSLDKSLASAEFLSSFITSLQLVLTKLVLSPKNLMMANTLYFLVNNKPIDKNSVKDILKAFECILREIIGDIIRKIIYEFLLPLVLRALKDLILCALTKKIKEKNINYLKSINSLLPPRSEVVNELFGLSENITSKVRAGVDSINLNSLNNVNIANKLGIKGKFCD